MNIVLQKALPGYFFQLVRFCLVGLANTAIDFTIYFSLTRLLPLGKYWYLIANVVAFFAANVFSFIVNKSWTFGNREYAGYYRQYMKFLTVSLGSVALVEATLFLFVSVLHIFDLIAKLVGVFLSFMFAFLVHRVWTFKPTTK